MTRKEKVVAYRHPDGYVEVQHGYGDTDDPGGVFDGDWTLRVRFEDLGAEDPGQIRSFELSMAAGVTPTAVQRLGWSRWLRVADAVARNPSPPYMGAEGTDFFDREQNWLQAEAEVQNRIGEAIAKALGEEQPLRRPGVKGHGDDFYRQIAQLYTSFVEAGQRSPTALVGEAFGRSRNTAAGWIRKARDKGFLQPPRWGKAG